MNNDEIKHKFADLANQLSPENLSCDGELSASQVRARRIIIKKEWEYLEMKLGKKVTEDDVWAGRV